MKMAIIFFIMFFLMIGLNYAIEMDHTIMADSSGSMAGFYNTGGIRMLVLNLQKILGGAKLYLFNDKGPELVDRADALHSIGRDTRIDLAIQKLLENKSAYPDSIWLITDNVQDRSETPYIDASTKDFYNILRQDDIAKIFIMPCYLDFDGKIYLNRNNRQSTENYTGRKGLVIYGILLNKSGSQSKVSKQDKKAKDDEKTKQFDDLANRFARTLVGYEPKLLLGKPLDKETFDLKPADMVPRSEKPNVILNEKGFFFGKGFKEGKKVPIVFYVKLLSKFEDLIVSGKVNASVINNQFKSQNFQNTGVGCDIYPEKVNINPGKTSEEIYKVTILLNKVKIRKDPVSILRAVFSGKPGMMEGTVRLEVQVPREGFRFTDEVLQKYNTDDLDDFKRIYGMGSLINYMPVDVTSIPIDYRFVLSVNYPYWPLVVVILLALAIVFLIYMIYRIFSSMDKEKYAISVGNQEERILPLAPIFSSFNISSGGIIFAIIYKKLGGDVVAKAKKGFIIDGSSNKKRLNKDLDSFNVSDSDNTNSVSVNFRVLKKEDSLDKLDSDLDKGF